MRHVTSYCVISDTTTSAYKVMRQVTSCCVISDTISSAYKVMSQVTSCCVISDTIPVVIKVMRLVTVLLCVLQWTYVNPLSFTRRVSTLAEIPSDIPSNVDYINIGNGLTTIGSYAFSQFGSLIILDLQSNQIVSVDDNAFANIVNLQKLYLSNNKLTVVPNFTSTCQNEQLYYLNLDSNQMTEIPSQVFINCIDIRELRIYSNKLTTLHHDSFLGMTSLTTLQLSRNLLTEVPFLPSLPALHYLYIYYNRISFWNDAAIPSMPKLYQIDANSNELAYVPPLPYLPTLRYLHLQINKIDCIEFSNSTPSLYLIDLAHNMLGSFPHFTHLGSSVKEIKMEHNLITHINTAVLLDMHGLNNIRIIKLNNNLLKEVYVFPCKPNFDSIYLTANRITYFNESSLADCVNILSIYLDSNLLPNITRYPRLTKLTHLYLQNNYIDYIPEDAFEDLVALTELYLHSNHLTMCPDVRSVGQSLTNLYLYTNPITYCNISYISNMTSLLYFDIYDTQLSGDLVLPMMPQLVRLKAYSLSGINNVPPMTLMNLPKIQTLSLYQTSIAHLIYTDTVELSNLITLNLFENKLKEKLTLPQLPRATTINIRHNYIESISKESLRGMKQLRVFNAEYNVLTDIPDFSVLEFPTLIEIYLNSNKITHIRASHLKGQTNLHKLVLKYNRIEAIPDLNVILPVNTLTIYLYSNPINCNVTLCWISERKKIHIDGNARCARPSHLKNKYVYQQDLTSLRCYSKYIDKH